MTLKRSLVQVVPVCGRKERQDKTVQEHRLVSVSGRRKRLF